MNRALPILSLCLALLALAFAAVPRDPVVPPPVPREPPRDDAALQRRVEQLENDNRALWDRVVLLERQKVMLVSDGGQVAPSVAAEVAQLREELKGLIAGEVLDGANRAALKEVIRETAADLTRERQAERQQQQEQRVLEQKARWKEFARSAKLTWPQEQELMKHFDSEEAARAALAQMPQQTGPAHADAFRALRDQRRETDQVMGALLDDTQRRQFEDLRIEDRGGGRGPRRGGPSEGTGTTEVPPPAR